MRWHLIFGQEKRKNNSEHTVFGTEEEKVKDKSITVVEKKEAERAVPMLVQIASQFESHISFTKDEKTANAKSIMGMLNFGLIPGQSIDVHIDGEDEDEAMERIEEYLTTK